MSKSMKILLLIGALLFYYINVPTMLIVSLSKPPLKDSFLSLVLIWFIFLLPVFVLVAISWKRFKNKNSWY
jgi:predicted permease